MQCSVTIEKVDLMFVVIRKREQRTRQRVSSATINSSGASVVCAVQVSPTPKSCNRTGGQGLEKDTDDRS